MGYPGRKSWLQIGGIRCRPYIWKRVKALSEPFFRAARLHRPARRQGQEWLHWFVMLQKEIKVEIFVGALRVTVWGSQKSVLPENKSK